MANNNKLTVGELVYKISGDGKDLQTELKKTEQEVTKLKTSIEKTDKSTKTFGDSLKNLAKGLGLAYLAKLMFDFGKASVQAFANAQQSLIQFNNAQENVAGSTKEQINDLNDYVSALEAKTTVDDKSIRQAAQILAQDQIKIENQKKLLAGIVDISVANAKSNGGEIDTQGTAVAIGRAMVTGELGALTRQNIVGIDATTAKMFKLASETERTAIMMKLLEANGKGAGEALGNSAQGGINKAKDKLEDIQVLVGKGSTVAFGTLLTGVLNTGNAIEDTSEKSNVFGSIMVGVAGGLGLVANSLELVWRGLQTVYTAVIGGGLVIASWAIDVIGNFKNVAKSITTVGAGFKSLLAGDFKGAVEAIGDLKENFTSITKPSETTKNILKQLGDDLEKVGDKTNTLTDKFNVNANSIINAGKVYKKNEEDIDNLTKAKDALNKKLEKEAELSEDAKKEMEELRNKTLDLKNKVDDLSVSLGEKLSDAVNKFKDSAKDIVTEGAKSLVDIVVQAERDITDLRKQLSEEQSKSQDKQSADSIKKLQDEIAQKQKILTSQAQFQNDLTAKTTEIQTRLAEATKLSETETDPAKKARQDATVEGLTLQLEALKGFSDLDKQIAEAKKFAGEDEFRQAQINTFAKLELATKLFIDETSKLREKQAIALDVENQITSFYKTQTNIRQKTLDTFATNAIAQLRKVGEEARSAMAALNEARSAGIQINSPIIPVTTPTNNGGTTASTPSSVTTNNNKNVNAPITVNATINDGTDPLVVAKDLQWQLSRTN